MLKNKPLIFMTLILFSSFSYAQCSNKKIDVNNKYQVTMEVLDIIDSINIDEGRISKASNSENRVDRLYAYKKENINFLCAIENINYLKSSDKETIKKGLVNIENYLKINVSWNNKLQKIEEDYLLPNGDLAKFQNGIADLKVEKDEFPKKLALVTGSLFLLILFEESDDMSIDFIKISNIKRPFIWITRIERNNIIQKISEIVGRKESLIDEGIATNIFIGLSIYVENFLSFKNKNILDKEEIIKNYKRK